MNKKEKIVYKILILEDELIRVTAFQKKFIGNIIDVTDNANEAISLIKNNTYDLIFLDHDLGQKQLEWDENNCGMLVANYLAETNNNTRVIIHTFNSQRAQIMKDIIPNAIYVPGVWLPDIAIL